MSRVISVAKGRSIRKMSGSGLESTAQKKEAFGWKASEIPQYMYAQGKNLRVATLTDVLCMHAQESFISARCSSVQPSHAVRPW